MGEGSEGIVVSAPHVVAISHSSSTCPQYMSSIESCNKLLALRLAHLVTARSPLRKYGGDGI